MPIYETVFVLDSQLEDSVLDKRVQEVLNFLSQHAERVINVERRGNRRLAYEIKKRQQGYYVLVLYEAPGTMIGELERMFRLDEAVLRYLTIRSEEKVEEEKKTVKEGRSRAVQESKEGKERKESA